MRRQNFIKGSVILMLSAAAAKALGAFFKIPLTNMLGGLGMSCFSCAYSIFMPVYALTVTGLSTAVARLVAESEALGMHTNTRRIRKTAHLLFGAVGLTGSLLIFLLAKPFSLITSGNTQSAIAIAMIAPSVFFGCVTAVERGYYEGMSNMYPTALSQAAEGIVKVAAGLSLCGYATSHSRELSALFPDITDTRIIAAAAGILGVTLSTVGSAAFFGILSIFSRRSEKGETYIRSRRSISADLIKTSLPIGLSALVTNLTGVADMLTLMGCIAYFGTKTPLPSGVSTAEAPAFIYGSFAGIALTVFNLVPSITNMLGKGVLPSVTEAWSSGNKAGLKNLSSRAVTAAAVIAVPAAFGLGILAPQVLHFLFPKKPDEAEICISALRLLMPGMVCLCLSFPIFGMLQGIGKASSPLKIMAVGTAVKIAGNLLLIPFFGADGAAVSTSLCYVLILAASLRSYIKFTGAGIEIKPILSVFLSGALCGAAAYLAADISSGADDILVIIISAAAGGAVYFLSLYLTNAKKAARNTNIQ